MIQVEDARVRPKSATLENLNRKLRRERKKRDEYRKEIRQIDETLFKNAKLARRGTKIANMTGRQYSTWLAQQKHRRTILQEEVRKSNETLRLLREQKKLIDT